MSVRRRQITYYSLRAGATCAFILAAFVLPRGAPAGMLALGAGVVAVLSGIGANAGGPGEQAGSRRQMDHYEQVRAPQGDWPPFDESRDIDGQVVKPETGLTPP
ncbi:MAG: hypothetical protein QOE05_3700 [Actinomycetota bacterium]|nr:hypothetical protein [Actinomycetota bacterium]